MSKRKSTDFDLILQRYKCVEMKLRQCYDMVKRDQGIYSSSSSSDSDDSSAGESQPRDYNRTREYEASDPIMSNVSINLTQVQVINSTVLDIAVHEDTEETANQAETSESDSDSNDDSNTE